MAERKFHVHLNMNENELQNAVFQNSSSNPTGVNDGQVFFDTDDDRLKVAYAGAYKKLLTEDDATAGTLAGLTDTNITAPALGNILVYDGADSWDNVVMSGDAVIDDTGALTVSSIGGDALDLGGNSVTFTTSGPTNVTLPTTGTLATIDDINGIVSKTDARVGTVANVNLANELENGDTIDGVTLATGDRVLVNAQTAGAENGIYVVQATGAAVRAEDLDEASEFDGGATIAVREGTALNGTVWFLSTAAPITVGTTPIAFTQINGAGGIIDGAGLDKTGNTLSVNTGEGIKIDSDDVALDINGLAGVGGPLFPTDQFVVYDQGASEHRNINFGSLAASFDGDGMSADGFGKLNVNAGEGLQIDTDNVALDIVGLASLGAMVAADEFVVYDVSAGEHKKVAQQTIAASLNGGGLNVDGSGQLNVNAGTGIQIAGDAVNLDINGLTTENTVDTANDTLAFYDASAGVERKATIDEIVSDAGVGTVKKFSGGLDPALTTTITALTHGLGATSDLHVTVQEDTGPGSYVEVIAQVDVDSAGEVVITTNTIINGRYIITG